MGNSSSLLFVDINSGLADKNRFKLRLLRSALRFVRFVCYISCIRSSAASRFYLKKFIVYVIIYKL